MVKLVIFDLDGTVCNTIEDLADATNYALRCLKYPEHTTEEYKRFVGNGISNLVKRSLPDAHKTDDECIKAKKLMLDYYSLHFADKSAPYPQISELLERLLKKDIHIAICTNKSHCMAEKIADVIFGGVFEYVIGQSEKYPLKPDPASAKEIMERFGALPEQTVFVGDSGVDMQTAKNAKTHSVGVIWGFRSEQELKENGAEHIAHTPIDILEIISNL